MFMITHPYTIHFNGFLTKGALCFNMQHQHSCYGYQRT